MDVTRLPSHGSSSRGRENTAPAASMTVAASSTTSRVRGRARWCWAEVTSPRTLAATALPASRESAVSTSSSRVARPGPGSSARTVARASRRPSTSR